MREIKLAAYSDSQGRMPIECFTVRFEDGVIKAFEHADNGEESECQIVQHTGMKDRKGVDIYDGDIVRSQFSVPEEHVDAWGKVEFCQESGAWRVRDNFGEFDLLFEDWMHCKVIGNIHSNPELLEKDQ